MPYDQSFIHLSVRSAYSLAEGAIRVVEDKIKGGGKAPRQDLIHLCLRHDMPAVALTDSGNLFGALEFSLAAVDAGIQPIIGCRVAVARTNTDEGNGIGAVTDSLVLLVQNEVGYRNLSALVTKSYLATDRVLPCVTPDELAQHTDGLIALSCNTRGLLGKLLLDGHVEAATTALLHLKKLFPSRLYIELSRHHGGDVGQAEAKIEEAMIDLAYAHDLPLVATNDVYFGDEDMYAAHDALLCIADKTIIAERNRRHLTPDHRFKSAAEMRALFADIPEACDNTLVIARRCAFMPRPRQPILPPFPTASGRSEIDELREQAASGLQMRLAENGITDSEPYIKRLEFELNVIISMGFPGYFLIVSDFIKWSKSNRIPVGPGRGSGAGSVVAWSLMITDLDPLRFGLLFERFLNPERVSMPDFDVDFCQERRDEVIRYVQSRYGSDRVAQIITFGKLQARAALRDTGRVLAMPLGQVDRLCKLVPNNPAHPVPLHQAIEGEPQLRQMRDEDPVVAQMMGIAIKLEGLYRNASTHAAGVVIGDRPLVELVPLYRDPEAALPATQFNMKMVETAGLVKFDFLGLKTLDVLQHAEDLLAARGEAINLAKIPLNDEKTFTMLSRGDTTGVFQLESQGMRDVLRRMHPNRFEDIIALVALYRPGPMDNIPSYIKRKNGEETPDYLHPLLEPMLKETFGIIVYQEQVMQAAQILAGYSLGAADLLRRAMGKKKAEEMAAQRASFIAGAAKNGLSDAQAGLIFDQIDKFAGYGFNKSHAAAYALIAYQTAWLKANHAVEFFAAAMNLELGDTDKLNVFRQELTRHGITLLPPDINKSSPLFAPEIGTGGRRAIRYALAAIKGVGMDAMRELQAERDKNGAFADLFDMAGRVDARALNRKQLESLGYAGAFDRLNPNRAQVIAGIDTLLRHSHAASDERASGQINMFGGAADKKGKGSAEAMTLPAAKPWDDLTRLRNEFQALGFYLSAHPLDGYAAILERLGVIPVSAVPARLQTPGGKRCKLAGLVTAKQERTAKSGNRFAFVQLSDTSGAFEITVFADLLVAKRDLLEAGNAVLVEAEAQAPVGGDNNGGGAGGAGAAGSGGDLRFIARNIESLKTIAEKNTQGIRITVYNPDTPPAVKQVLAKAKTGRGKVSLLLDLDDDVAEVELVGGWHLSEELKTELSQLGDGLVVQAC